MNDTVRFEIRKSNKKKNNKKGEGGKKMTRLSIFQLNQSERERNPKRGGETRDGARERERVSERPKGGPGQENN